MPRRMIRRCGRRRSVGLLNSRLLQDLPSRVGRGGRNGIHNRLGALSFGVDMRDMINMMENPEPGMLLLNGVYLERHDGAGLWSR